jgi:hypothetical protein
LRSATCDDCQWRMRFKRSGLGSRDWVSSKLFSLIRSFKKRARLLLTWLPISLLCSLTNAFTSSRDIPRLSEPSRFSEVDPSPSLARETLRSESGTSKAVVSFISSPGTTTPFDVLRSQATRSSAGASIAHAGCVRLSRCWSSESDWIRPGT